MLQSIVNRLLLPVSRYHGYNPEMPEWAGVYRCMGRAVAFRGKDGTMQYRW